MVHFLLPSIGLHYGMDESLAFFCISILVCLLVNPPARFASPPIPLTPSASRTPQNAVSFGLVLPAATDVTQWPTCVVLPPPSLIGPPISGWLISYRHGSFESAQIFSGVMLLVGSYLIVSHHLRHSSPHEKVKRRQTMFGTDKNLSFPPLPTFLLQFVAKLSVSSKMLAKA